MHGPCIKDKKLSILPVLVALMILIPFIFAAGCSKKSQGVSESLLNGTRWILTDYVWKGTTMQTLNGTAVTLDFSEEGRITWSAGCNHYFATCTITGTAIMIGPQHLR